MRPHPFSLWYQIALLGFEAQMVIGLRMMRLMAGGARAEAELLRMTSEKIAASTAAVLDAAAAAAAGKGSEVIARRTVRGYRTRVRANRRRLTKP